MPENVSVENIFTRAVDSVKSIMSMTPELSPRSATIVNGYAHMCLVKLTDGKHHLSDTAIAEIPRIFDVDLDTDPVILDSLLHRRVRRTFTY